MKCLSLFWKSAEKPRPPSSFSSGRHDNTTSCTSNSCEVSGMGSFRTIADMFEQKIGSLRTFDLAELYVATNGFSRRMRIGEGGFGSVYRGVVKSPRGERVQVAVKKLNREGLQGNKEWRAEIQFLSVVDHPNLVKLLGYCGEENNEGIQRLLIYEFMPNRSLEDHLFTKGQIYLSWETRLKIALGAAEGLRYLHEGLQIQVIYRDFKASNILLDDNFNAKLSDFGLAREGPSDGRSHVTTHVMGTCGYASPDYIRTGHLTIKSDVWSFGVVLFEILTGRRCLEPNLPRPERKLLDWMKGFPAESRRFSMIIDPKLKNRYSLSAARSVAKLADTCLYENPKARPTMSQVVESLKSAIGDSVHR